MELWTIRRSGLVRLALLALIWGSSFVWIKIGLRGFTPMQVAFLRVLLAAGVLLLIYRLRGLRMPREPVVWMHFAVAAMVGNVVPFFLFGVGELSIDSGLAGILNATTPLWTVTVALLARMERPTAVRAGGLLLGFAGALVIFAPWRSSGGMSGAAACLTASMLYGVLFVYAGRYLAGRGLNPAVLSTGQLTAAAVLSACALPIGWRTPELRMDALGGVIVLGVLGTGLAYILNYRLITDDGPTVASTVTYLIPVVAVLFGVAVLGESLSLRVLAGMVIVLAGVGLIRRTARPPVPVAASPGPDMTTYRGQDGPYNPDMSPCRGRCGTSGDRGGA
ncbi:MAG TPA: DMT family transporter [Pseudonocardiaceae bacterium]|nr:DMT family transporter [Pseudonocardiaceae bacterium]